MILVVMHSTGIEPMKLRSPQLLVTYYMFY